MIARRLKLGLLSLDGKSEPRTPFVAISIKDRDDDEIAVVRVTEREWQSLADIADAIQLLSTG